MISNHHVSFIICRSYIQPQWVFDCVNCQQVLPVDEYLPGSILPAHLSPFVEEKADDYIPPERKEILDREKKLLLHDAGEEDTGMCNQLFFYFLP